VNEKGKLFIYLFLLLRSDFMDEESEKKIVIRPVGPYTICTIGDRMYETKFTGKELISFGHGEVFRLKHLKREGDVIEYEAVPIVPGEGLIAIKPLIQYQSQSCMIGKKIYDLERADDDTLLAVGPVEEKINLREETWELTALGKNRKENYFEFMALKRGE
jgi:hypothetical protein